MPEGVPMNKTERILGRNDSVARESTRIDANENLGPDTTHRKVIQSLNQQARSFSSQIRDHSCDSREASAWFRLGIAAMLLLAGCKRSGGGSPAVMAPPSVPVQTAVAQQLDVPRVIESVGAMQALRTVAVKSQV